MPQLSAVRADERRRWRELVGDAGAHDRAVDELAALNELEMREPPAPTSDPVALHVVAWNVKRGGNVDEIAAILTAASCDIALLTELDVGMARSGNLHTPAAIADRLEQGYVYAVEFVELSLGNVVETELAEHDGMSNQDGFHGNAILSRLPIVDPKVVRIEANGAWFKSSTTEPRIGGRVALLARLSWSDRHLVVGSVHLESESDPALRAEQFGVVLDALDDFAGDSPVVFGGDLNTFSTTGRAVMSPDGYRRLTDQDPDRWAWPVPYEPLFELATDRGYTVDAANQRMSTVRFAVDQAPGTLPRLDWLLTRGVDVADPTTIPAVSRYGEVISDHDAVGVTIS